MFETGYYITETNLVGWIEWNCEGFFSDQRERQKEWAPEKLLCMFSKHVDMILPKLLEERQYNHDCAVLWGAFICLCPEIGL